MKWDIDSHFMGFLQKAKIFVNLHQMYEPERGDEM